MEIVIGRMQGMIHTRLALDRGNRPLQPVRVDVRVGGGVGVGRALMRLKQQSGLGHLVRMSAAVHMRGMGRGRRGIVGMGGMGVKISHVHVHGVGEGMGVGGGSRGCDGLGENRGGEEGRGTGIGGGKGRGGGRGIPRLRGGVVVRVGKGGVDIGGDGVRPGGVGVVGHRRGGKKGWG